MLEELEARAVQLGGEVERERARSEQAFEAHERSKSELALAQLRVTRVEEEMRSLLRAHETQKAASNQKVAELAKLLAELQGSAQLY